MGSLGGFVEIGIASHCALQGGGTFLKCITESDRDHCRETYNNCDTTDMIGFHV